MRNPHTVRTALVALLLAVAPACNRQPNVLLVSIDSLRADHVGAYGYRFETTPAFDRLAEDGALFTNAFSTTSWTLPAHAALFTGLPDSVHGVVLPTHRLDPGVPTLAESMFSAGYRTVGFYAGPFLHPLFGLSRGFEGYVDCTSYGAGKSAGKDAEKKIAGLHTKSHADVTNPRILDAVREQLGLEDKRPFFFFVHMWDVHYDYIPPAPYDTMFDPDYTGTVTGERFKFNKAVHKDMPPRDLQHVVALYDGEIRYTDDTLGDILAELEKRNLLSNTLVVVTSDHGEEFFEHGRKGHRQALYDESTHIPLVFRLPRLIAANTIAEPVSLIDVAPTILELLRLPPMARVPGRPLTPLLGRSTQPWLYREAVSELQIGPKSRIAALRGRTEKLIAGPGKSVASYFDLARDPAERAPVRVRPDTRGAVLADVLRKRLEEYDTLAKRIARAEAAQIDAETEAELRSLGYLD